MVVLLIITLTYSLTSVVEIPFLLRKGVQKIEFYYSPDGREWFLIASKLNPNYPNEWKDKFVWYFRGKYPKNGKIKGVYISQQRKYEKEIQNIKVKIKKEKDSEYFYYGRRKKVSKEDTPYSWRMLGYDAQHTGYYPYPLYPPLEFKWRFSGIRAHDFLMLQGCAAHGMLYIGDGEHRWILALDIETGEVVWERGLTSNVWCAVLCPGDSILFVGTSIGGLPKEPTFFALDPLTGEEKWSKHLWTIQYSPIIVETLLYAPTGQGDTCFALTLKSNLIWKDKLTRLPPTWWENKIYGAKEPLPWDPPETPYVFYCRDAFTGDSIWEMKLPGAGHWSSAYQGKVFFFATDTLFALDAKTGEVVWEKTDFSTWLNIPIRHSGEVCFVTDGMSVNDTTYTDVKAYNISSGILEWRSYLAPKDPNGGWSNMGISTVDIIWIPNRDYIYVLNSDNGSIIGQFLLPESQQVQGSWGFPIVYKDYFIGAHRSFIYCYKGDTIPPQDTTYSFTFYGYQTDKGNIQFFISIPEENEVILKLYDITGRLREKVYEGDLSKGKHYISWKTQILSSGVYFALLSAGTYKEGVKIIYLK
jgi:outer membrane protein assembly factor BamB